MKFVILIVLFLIPWSLYAQNQRSQIPIFSTGVDDGGTPLPLGSVDPHFVVVETGNQAVVLNPAHQAWLPNDATSQWVWLTSDSAKNINKTWTLRITFDLKGFDPSTAKIDGLVAVDNGLSGIKLNGKKIPSPSAGFTSFTRFSITSGFQPGINTLEFIATDWGVVAGFNVQLSGAAHVATPSPIAADDSCAEQASRTNARLKAAEKELERMRAEWQDVSKRFPSKSKREFKQEDVFIGDEQDAVNLVQELLKNGGVEDNYLHNFNWERYKNDVLFAFTYIEKCQGQNFEQLRLALKKQRKSTADRLLAIEGLSKKVEALVAKDKVEFQKANENTVDIESVLLSVGIKIGQYALVDYLKSIEKIAEKGKIAKFSVVLGVATAVHEFYRAARGWWDAALMAYLLPRILERMEVLAYLNGLGKRYEDHLDMQDVMMESLEKARFEHDCEKCKPPR